MLVIICQRKINKNHVKVAIMKIVSTKKNFKKTKKTKKKNNKINKKKTKSVIAYVLLSL